MTYRRVTAALSQGELAAKRLSNYTTGAELVVGVRAMLSDLEPTADDRGAVELFEEAMSDLGAHLGFEAQRPERDTGNGPDVLWAMGELRYAVIECKSGGEADLVARRDAAQLSHSMDWFASSYDASCQATPS